MLLFCPTLVSAAPASMEKSLLFGSAGTPAAPAMTEGGLISLFNTGFRAFEKGDEATWKAGVDPNLHLTNPSFGFDFTGVDVVWASARQFATTVPPNINTNPNAEFNWMLMFGSHIVDLAARTVTATMQSVMKENVPELGLTTGQIVTMSEWQVTFGEDWKVTNMNHDIYFSFFLAQNGYGGSNWALRQNTTGSFP
jgi:hypothetical protein